MFNMVMRNKCFCFTVAVSALSCLAAHCTRGKDLISDMSACFESLQLVNESRRHSPSINVCRPQIGGRSRNPHRLLRMHFGKFSCYPMSSSPTWFLKPLDVSRRYEGPHQSRPSRERGQLRRCVANMKLSC